MLSVIIITTFHTYSSPVGFLLCRPVSKTEIDFHMPGREITTIERGTRNHRISKRMLLLLD